MGLNFSSEATEIPALLRCDGHYQLHDNINVPSSQNFGWLRFEGNGGVILKAGDACVNQTRGEWSVVAIDTVQIALPVDASVANGIPHTTFVKEGDEEDTVIVIAGANSEEAGVLFRFVPEEEPPG